MRAAGFQTGADMSHSTLPFLFPQGLSLDPKVLESPTIHGMNEEATKLCKWGYTLFGCAVLSSAKSLTHERRASIVCKANTLAHALLCSAIWCRHFWLSRVSRNSTQLSKHLEQHAALWDWCHYRLDGCSCLREKMQLNAVSVRISSPAPSLHTNFLLSGQLVSKLDFEERNSETWLQLR